MGTFCLQDGMNRRRFVAAVGASLALAGCATEGSVPETDDDDVTPATPPSIDETTTEQPRTDPPPGSGDRETPADGPRETRDGAFAVGERVGEFNPMGLAIDNDGPDERTVRLEITDTQAEAVLVERTFDVSSELRGELRSPTDYEIRVAVPAEGIETVETIDEGVFDTCNSYGTTISISRGGEFERETMSTLVACDADLTVSDHGSE